MINQRQSTYPSREPVQTSRATSLKQFRRVAARYDKLLANFIGFVKLATIAIWLR